MTEQTDAAEVETLAALLWQADRDSSVSGRGFGATYAVDPCLFAYRAQARAVLASDWLAADRAAQRRLGAEEADSVRDAKFGNLRWLDGHQQGLKDGAEAVVAAIEAKAMGREPNMTFAVILDAARAAAQQVGGER